MKATETMTQTTVSLDGRSHVLAQNQNLEDLRRRIQDAVGTTGQFVSFTVVGNRSVSVLVSGRTRVLLTTEAVLLDPRDDGDLSAPFGGAFDML